MSYMTKAVSLSIALAIFTLAGIETLPAQSNYGIPIPEPPTEPIVLGTAEVPSIQIIPVATGLEHPWGMAFRDNGDILVTERDTGKLRVIREGRLLAASIPGVPEVYSGRLRAGLMDITLHPEDDELVYLTYSKPVEWEGEAGFTVALARGRLQAGELIGIQDLFVADGLDLGIAASRLLLHERRGVLRVRWHRRPRARPSIALRKTTQAQRRRVGSARQSIHPSPWLPAGNLFDGASEPDRPRFPSCDP